MKTLAWSFVAGLLFATGLVVSGMTRPEKVVGFLDIFGAWDASLAFVMMGAIGVHAALFRFIARRGRTWAGAPLQLPTRKDMDSKLIAGAALFGVGWGLVGVCPGPGIVSAMSGAGPFLTFLAAMLAGMALFSIWAALRARNRPPPSLPA